MLGTAKVITLLHAALLAVSGDAQAHHPQIPTIVEASAMQSDGNKNTFIIEQPKNSPNPLGDPISFPDNAPQIPQQTTDVSSQTPTQKQPTKLNSSELGKDFQNTLLEANGMVYDVQSYPKEDIPVIEDSANPQTIYSPNVNP